MYATGPGLKSRAGYTRAFGDGPRNFEPWLSDVDDTWAGTLSPNSNTTPPGGRISGSWIRTRLCSNILANSSLK
ncbi:hypothetical protein TNCV_2512551 [Trichonephila clavipes]|nr:hypothetical protein TNCV_2512551 [Trichonephila clavipes]